MTSQNSSSEITFYRSVNFIPWKNGIELKDTIPVITIVREPDIFQVQKHRSGVVIYGIDKSDNEIWFGLGIDARYGDLTDFGGSSETIDSDYLDTAIREFEQESIGCFGEHRREHFYHDYVVSTRKMSIIFHFMDIDFNEKFRSDICTCFQILLPLQKDPKRKEISGIQWIKGKELKQLCGMKRNETTQAVYRHIRKHMETFLEMRLPK